MRIVGISMRQELSHRSYLYIMSIYRRMRWVEVVGVEVSVLTEASFGRVKWRFERFIHRTARHIWDIIVVPFSPGSWLRGSFAAVSDRAARSIRVVRVRISCPDENTTW